jgi:hypothetical protein
MGSNSVIRHGQLLVLITTSNSFHFHHISEDISFVRASGVGPPNQDERVRELMHKLDTSLRTWLSSTGLSVIF